MTKMSKFELDGNTYRFTNNGVKTLLEIYDNEGYLQSQLTSEKPEQDWEFENHMNRFITINNPVIN